MTASHQMASFSATMLGEVRHTVPSGDAERSLLLPDTDVLPPVVRSEEAAVVDGGRQGPRSDTFDVDPTRTGSICWYRGTVSDASA